MLSMIRVRNYAIVDEVELEFGPGLSVVTGETGAGKSILVDALGLALGDRADASAVRHGAERAEISVLFECPPEHPALDWLAELGLDDGDHCALRRIIGKEGRSRAFINNQPVRLQDLRRLGSMLVDIHGQHAHQSLLKSSNQRALLDAHGRLEELAARVAELHRTWRDAEEQLDAKRGGNAEREAELELLRFQAAELGALALAEREPAELAAERSRLANTDKLAAGLEAAIQALYEAETGAAHSLVAHAQQSIARLVEHDEELGAQAERLAAAEIELRDVAHALIHYRDRLESDPERLERVEARLAKIRALARRHHVEEDALPGVLEKLNARIAELDAGGESIDELEDRARRASEAYFSAARKLSKSRNACAAKLAEAVSAQLPELGLPHGLFRVDVTPKPDERADGTGLDSVEFQVQLNPGQPFGPLARMASGGELSRIGLALEVVGARASAVPTFVFDEVDSGIGGGVAEIVGRKLAQIAASHQVMCVTHLPQVASQGRQHYRVAKLTDGRTSRTTVRQLSHEERIEELSRMLGGVEITAVTRAHAEEMIGRAAEAARSSGS
ncbi:MAG: DNA repair protein RecN [Gammaproteobacteria bacterium]|nr:DNA repair protein RecN [Gammaproteobacteria bacterium]